MKILVTGSLGNIGRDIVEYLLSKNFFILGLGKKKNTIIHNKNFDYVTCDIRNTTELKEVFQHHKGIEVVVHLAALISFEQNSSLDLMEINSFSTYHLCYLSNVYKVKKFIYISSIPITASSSKDLDELNYVDDPKTVYHFSKLSGENLIKDPTFNIDTVVLRIPSPIFKNLKPSIFFHTIVSRALQNEPITIFGSGSRVQNYIHVLDIARAIEKAIIGNSKGIYFIGGVSISNLDLVNYVIKVLNSKSLTLFINNSNSSDDNLTWLISNNKAFNDFNFRPIFELDSMIDLIKFGINNI
jgi:UDP-glucose 4-epimerase